MNPAASSLVPLARGVAFLQRLVKFGLPPLDLALGFLDPLSRPSKLETGDSLRCVRAYQMRERDSQHFGEGDRLC